MTYDLTKFDLGDMLKCSLRLREAASGAFSRFDDASVFNQTLLSTVGAART